jgi:2-methylisocitrate lyase-like PEP mutase family enzyme/predicted TIM-barrel fold metal-dependent hydrolase
MTRSPAARLKELIHRRDKVLAVLHPPSATLARIMEQAGCEALFVGTGGVVGAYTGLADVGTATMSECLQIAGWIAGSVAIPVMVDGDTGHGGIMAVRRLIRESIRAGLAGIRIDDQPIEGKRKTQNAGIDVVPLGDAIVRYRAAVDMKNELDPNFVVMAQCYARDANGGSLDDTIVRMKAYREQAGVDWVQFESPHSVDEIKAARAAVAGPFSFMRGKLGRYLSLDEHLALDVNIAWYPGFSHAVTWAALWDFMTAFREKGTAAWDDFVASRRDRPYPTPETPASGEGDAKQQARVTVFRRTGRQVMARDGYRIFDSDTHVGPDAAILSAYLSAAEKERLAGWEPYRSTGRFGHVTYTRGQRQYRRRLGDARPDEAPAGYMAGFTGVKRTREPSPKVDADPAARIADMDFEGVDVNLTLPSGWFGTWGAGEDIALEMAMYRAYHRWMDDYCGAYPRRLGGVILAGARDIAGGLAEIRRWGRSRWAWGMMVYAPVGMPLDHPDLEPFYAESAALDLAVVLHSFTVMPPYAPGGEDTWDNLWLQRSAAHPWCGMRNMAALIGGGVMDRYPMLRVGTLEAGHGWLPFWIARLDEHAETIKAALPELRRRPSDYVKSGRYFQSIEIPEGAALTNAVSDLVGDEVLMYASDYPHGESHFPESAGLVAAWGMSEDRKRKLL